MSTAAAGGGGGGGGGGGMLTLREYLLLPEFAATARLLFELGAVDDEFYPLSNARELLALVVEGSPHVLELLEKLRAAAPPSAPKAGPAPGKPAAPKPPRGAPPRWQGLFATLAAEGGGGGAAADAQGGMPSIERATDSRRPF
jgi:hypothetical protein